jgi:hypothetical protein
VLSRPFLAAVLPAVLALAPLTAQAEEAPPTEQLIAIPDTTAAALLMQAGRLEDAKLVLTRALTANPNDSQAEFLLGMIAVAQEDYDTAISHFRAILVREPNAERVRLELARAFFLKQDYDNAARQFRFARAGELPPEVAANIDQYLNAIVGLREWSYNFSLALAEDTNINAATDLTQVDIYGLPFVLSDQARKTSGTGLAVDAGVEWSPRLTETLKARLGLQGHRSEYSGGAFDDMTISAHAGPEILFPRTQLVLLATGFERWFGNDLYNTGFGGRVSTTYLARPRVQLGTFVDGQYIRFQTGTEQNGWIGSTALSAAYTLTPSSTLRGVFGFALRDARADAYSSTTWWGAIGYYRDLPFGFSAYAEPHYSRTRFHAPLIGFGATRRDQVWSIKLDLLNRRIDYFGLTPKFTSFFAAQDSNIPLYSYDRSQVTVALTREF